MQMTGPLLFEHRTWVAIVYAAVCCGLCAWLGELLSGRQRRLHGADHPLNADEAGR